MKHLLSAFILLFSLSITPAPAQTVDDGIEAKDAGDYGKAKSVLLPFAEAGNAKAMNAIGIMHGYGNGFPKNETNACNWFEKAAKVGYASAQNNYSICFEKGNGRELNPTKAQFWAIKSAEQGYVNAQISLIDLLVQKDRDKAMYWGQKAVDQGSALARVAMWGYDLPHTGRQASFRDITCVFVMNGLFDKDWSYCD